MAELCTNLSLSIFKEPDPFDKGKEQVRIVLSNELEMLEVTECYQINQSAKPHQSHRYYIKEAVTLALRRAVSEAFDQGLISDSLGSWTITKPATAEPSSTLSEIELEL